MKASILEIIIYSTLATILLVYLTISIILKIKDVKKHKKELEEKNED